MRISKTFLTILFVLSGIMSGYSQMQKPLTWSFRLEESGKTERTIVIDAKIARGWHIYDVETPEGGPDATTVKWNREKMKGVEVVGGLVPDSPAEKRVDFFFNLMLGVWENHVTFRQKIKLTDPDNFHVSGYIQGQACNDQTCKIEKEAFEFEKVSVVEKPDTVIPVVAAPVSPVIKEKKEFEKSSYWEPVTIAKKEDSTLAYIFLGGFLGGLLALLTPCVWPMIPLVVGFFLKRVGSRKKTISYAMIYGASIIVIYLLLGLFVTVAFGPNTLNELSTSALFNVLFFVLFVIFAISFFGAFEITMPSKLTNTVNTKANKTTGLVSVFFMAFTLVLVSFSCTGPIIGTLLVEAVSLGDLTGPAVGMGGFALALAIPFTLFAIFPTWLHGLPKSGGWLNTVKVVLGFIELALSLKFLSVADLAYGWRILDREVFLSLWIVIFFLMGLYLLKVFRFEHDSKKEGVGSFRLMLAVASLAFSVYLLPGLWGAPLKSVSAFTPPLWTQDFNLHSEGQFIKYDEFDKGMDAAKEMGKPVFLDFSGFGCVNCRKMEASVFEDDRVKRLIESDFVMITLMVDDKRELPEPVVLEQQGKKMELQTYGDLWSYLQQHKFMANTQPYYVVLDNEGNLLSGPVSYDENIGRFVDFLEDGLKNYKKNE